MISDKKVLRLFPKYHRDNKTREEIAEAQRSELDRATAIGKRSFYNSFIITADVDGIWQYEQILQIRPDINHTLEFRKGVVRNRLALRMPFTRIFLEQTLESLFGSGKWFLEIDVQNFIVHVDIETYDNALYDDTIRNIRQIIPANMILMQSSIQPYTHRYLNRNYTHGQLTQFTYGHLSQFA